MSNLNLNVHKQSMTGTQPHGWAYTLSESILMLQCGDPVPSSPQTPAHLALYRARLQLPGGAVKTDQ